MNKLLCFIKKEPVLTVAALLAAASMFFVPPDSGYLDYMNFSVLSLLFCLMAVVAGLRACGVFDALSGSLCERFKSERGLAAALTAACFLSSMLITNDVTLITFVPFTIELFSDRDERRLIYLLVLETVAANLGSMATPIGNPQNLYIFSFYSLSAGEFFSAVLPVWALSLALVALLLLLFKDGGLKAPEASRPQLDKRRLALYAALFALCILTVLRLVPWYFCLAAVAAAFLISDRSVFGKIDYTLLITFVCFFVFVGNAARIDEIKALAEKALTGRELLFSALLSQVISNVPAATMLASFTENWRALLQGVNIGGLGTLIASMASLITYRLYCVRQSARRGEFLMVFSAVNLPLLALLLAAAIYIL